MGEQEDLQSAVNNIHQSLIDQTEKIIFALSQQSDFMNQAFRWVEYANQLHRLTPDYAVPGWLSDACTKFGSLYKATPQYANLMADFVTKRTPEIVHPILVGDASTLNLEQLFAAQYARFHLNQVFESLISRLSELIAADVIDNRLVHDSLTRLNALFKRTKNGSLSTVLLTMNFGRFFLRSFGGVLKANKYAKPIIESFESEFSEASAIVQQAEEETKKEMILRLINVQRMELFIASNPDLEDTVAGFLPARSDSEESQQCGAGQSTSRSVSNPGGSD